MKVHPLVGAAVTVLAVVAFRAGRGALALRKFDADCRVIGPARLSSLGRLPHDEATRAFETNHRRCVQLASVWSLRKADFDRRRYEACLDAVAASHWRDRVVLAGGDRLEQDPDLPGSWRTEVSASGRVPEGMQLEYEHRCDGARPLGWSSSIGGRSGRVDAAGAYRIEVVIAKQIARRCAGTATVIVTAKAGEWLLGPPLVIPVPRESAPTTEPPSSGASG